MGASNPYKTYEGTIKKDDKWEAFLKKFDLSTKQAKILFKTFQKIDKKKKGEINFSQFAKAWKIEKNDLGIIGRFFSQVDADKSSGGEDSVYFQEWAVMTYDFCTLRMDGIVEWTFKLFDPDNSGSLTIEEFKEMGRLCMGDEAGTPGTEKYKTLVGMWSELNGKKANKITLQQFRLAEKCKAGPVLFMAMIEFQQKLRKSIINDKWWTEASKYRYQVANGRNPLAIYEKGGTYVRPVKGKKGAAAPSKKKVAPVDDREDD